jgi:hypothetical protein
MPQIISWVQLLCKATNCLLFIAGRSIDAVAASRVLQFSTINQQHNNDDASRNKLGCPKDSTDMARLDPKEKRRKAKDLVATKYSEEKKANGEKLVPIHSFQKIVMRHCKS